MVTPSLALQSLRSAGLASHSVTNAQDQLLMLSLGKFSISAKNSLHINSLLQDPGSRACSTAHCGFVINIYLTEEQSLPKEKLLTSARTIFPSEGGTASLFLKGDISPHKKFLPPSWHHASQDLSPHPWVLHLSRPAQQHAITPGTLLPATRTCGYWAIPAIWVQVQAGTFPATNAH